MVQVMLPQDEGVATTTISSSISSSLVTQQSNQETGALQMTVDQDCDEPVEDAEDRCVDRCIVWPVHIQVGGHCPCASGLVGVIAAEFSVLRCLINLDWI